MVDMQAAPDRMQDVDPTPTRLMRWRRHAWRYSPGRHPWIAVGAATLCALVALPILTVLSNVFVPSSGALGHIARTILPEILRNTVGLLLMVGVGTAAIGTACAWLVTMYRFPASRVLAWLLLLPMAMPAYIIGYAYTDFMTFAGPLQSALRRAFGWSRGDYWFPELQSLWGVSLMLTLVLYPYVYFLARSAFLEQSPTALDVARTLGHGGRDRFDQMTRFGGVEMAPFFLLGDNPLMELREDLVLKGSLFAYVQRELLTLLDLQTALDNAEGGLTPLGLPQGSLARGLAWLHGARRFAAAHQAGNLVDFDQPVHAGPQPELIAMILRTEVSVAAHTKPAEGFPAKLAVACVHCESL
jgi:ABC-type sulfate transport system permease component